MNNNEKRLIEQIDEWLGVWVTVISAGTAITQIWPDPQIALLLKLTLGGIHVSRVVLRLLAR